MCVFDHFVKNLVLRVHHCASIVVEFHIVSLRKNAAVFKLFVISHSFDYFGAVWNSSFLSSCSVSLAAASWVPDFWRVSG